MHIKTARFNRLVTGLLITFTISFSAYGASSAAPISPYKLNAESAQKFAPEQIPQPSNLKPNTALPVLPQAYQLEYKYRSQSITPKRIHAELLPATGKPASKKTAPVAMPEAVLGTFTPETLANEKLTNQPFSKEIALAASAASLDPALVHAVIYVESHYRHSAISPKGAIGLMQVLPETAARYGVADPGKSRKANLKAGTLYLRDLMRMFDNRIDLALAAYNAGEGAVLKHAMRIPPYRETRLYVVAVMAKYNEWRNYPPVEETPTAQDKADEDLLPVTTAAPVKPEYLAGTRLAATEILFAPNY